MAADTMNPVVHFEMPAEDRHRMRHFYETTFCWKTEQLGPDMGDYVLVTTSETDKRRGPKKPGMINGGFYPKKEDWPAQYPSVVIAVDDIKTSMKKVEAAGGRVLGEPMEIPGYGLYVSFFDTEGNRVSMMQPDQMWTREGKSQ
jgi:predicted enzyme related to lactoylglutathione lyase